MDVEQTSSADLLEQRLSLLHELATSLERSQAAVLQSDIDQMCAQTFQQQKICHELRRIPRAGVGQVCQRSQALGKELQRIENKIARLNLTYGALLRRARRTLDIFCRVLANSGVTYVAPPGLQAIPLRRDSKG